MSGASRVPTQADFDLDRFIKLMDQALTSKDPRVKDALRSLLMIVALTDPEPESDQAMQPRTGPLRQLVEDMWNINRRLNTVEEELRQQRYERLSPPQIGPWITPGTGPYTGPTWTSTSISPEQLDTSTVSAQNNFKMPNRTV
jgi:hypothetical protein